MDIRILTLARYAEVNPDGTSTLVGAGLDVWPAQAIPVQIPMLYLVIKFAMTREESSKPHILQVRILTPGGESLFTTDPICFAEEQIPPDRNFLVPNLRLAFANITFAEEGLHVFQLVFDDEPLKECKLRIAIGVSQPTTEGQFTEGAHADA